VENVLESQAVSGVRLIFLGKPPRKMLKPMGNAPAVTSITEK
jgi:hypothetical protein